MVRGVWAALALACLCLGLAACGAEEEDEYASDNSSQENNSANAGNNSANAGNNSANAGNNGANAGNNSANAGNNGGSSNSGAVGAACRSGGACGEGLFCDAPCDGEGTCQPIPEVCPELFAPVCACDGQTYDSECFANGAGLGIFGPGECEKEPGPCVTNDDCDPDQWCAGPDGACGEGGLCKQRPQACDQDYTPVCGCDGQTHSNACSAASQGVSVASQGECP
jgi:hypothetical protein